ncbi:MAG: 4-(cytidine 5'-diphospho)-2-C-methyl-D-erythritol kinase [Prevotellaceae bacterium]|jgi:4-diphosphocytidyl-2-C-methyl-D-erythritol kinase|nr:4-(cytidine 5'-diphospho)-2-C-methyl-D-erythritol kinase [Prevotellaceae bacterium]
MVTFPNAKINIGLNVVEKRDDGFHNIKTVFFPVAGLTDILEIVESDRFSFDMTGIEINSPTEKNLCVKAFRIMEKEYGLPPVAIHLHKIIPSGAGLGGGSSDASFTLISLNRIFGLGLLPEQLKTIAVQIGSDCAFFIDNIPSKASGRGEILEPLALDLSGLYLTIVKPDIHIDTGNAYGATFPKHAEYDVFETVLTPPEKWKDRLKNDFEESVFAKYPPIAEIKNQMYRHGAVYASMSGSGASVFGLFREKSQNDRFVDSVPKISCFVKTYIL